MIPRIGFTSREQGRDYFHKWQRDYWWALIAAGAEPFRLVPEEVSDYEAALDTLDGLLLTGGGDLHPRYYGQKVMGTERPSIHPERDRLEMGLIAAARVRRMPILGICRGFQVLNVAFGGSLTQHVDDHTAKSQSLDGPKRHLIQIRQDSLLDRVLGSGPDLETNSYHHQAVRPENLAPGLIAAAVTSDGLIEAIEHPDHPWLLAVQWHPERLYELPPAHRRLFAAFVAAARRYHGE